MYSNILKLTVIAAIMIWISRLTKRVDDKGEFIKGQLNVITITSVQRSNVQNLSNVPRTCIFATLFLLASPQKKLEVVTFIL